MVSIVSKHSDYFIFTENTISGKYHSKVSFKLSKYHSKYHSSYHLISLVQLTQAVTKLWSNYGQNCQNVLDCAWRQLIMAR